LTKYTHKDADGMLWRWEEGRPISKIADEVMKQVLGEMKKRKSKVKSKKKK